MTDIVYVGDYGATITIDLGEDISSAVSYQVLLKKPNNGTTVTKTGSLSGTTAVQCTLADGDIDTAGLWKVQAVVNTATGQFHSSLNSLSAINGAL